MVSSARCGIHSFMPNALFPGHCAHLCSLALSVLSSARFALFVFYSLSMRESRALKRQHLVI